MAKSIAALEAENEQLRQDLADAEDELTQLEDQIDEIADIASGASDEAGED
jgi:cell division protein FtsB